MKAVTVAVTAVTKLGRTLLLLLTAGLTLLSACMSPLEKAAWKKSYGFSAAEVIQPPSEDETVVDTVDWYYTETRSCSGKKPPESIYGQTRCHATEFGPWMAARESLRRYAEKFPNTGIDEVKDLYVRSVKQTGATRFSGNETVSYANSAGKKEDQYDATTTFSFQGVIVKRKPPAPNHDSVGAAGQGR